MSINKNWINTELKEIVIYLMIGIVLTVLLPYFSGFVLRGFEESIKGEAFSIASYLGAYIVYIPLIIISLFLIIFPISRLIAGNRKDHPATRKKPTWFTIFTVSLIHSPEEQGLLYRAFHGTGNKGKSNPMNWSISFWRNFIIAILLFGGLAIVQVNAPQLVFSKVPDTAQQITATSDILFGAGVPSFSENGWLCFTFFLGLGIIAYLNSKLKGNLVTYFTFGILLCFLMGLLWMGYHSIVYGSSESDLFFTFIFGTVGSMITLLTGSFIYWLVWHFMNNFILKLLPYIQIKEDLILIMVVSWIILLVIYIVIELNLRKRRIKTNIIVPE